MKFMLKAPETKRLKVRHDGLLSNFAFNFNLRRYITGAATVTIEPFFTALSVKVRRCMLTPD